MKKVYLYGHTGSTNRGCEAIVRSSVDILKRAGVDDVTLVSFNLQGDKNVGLDSKVKIIPYPKKNIFSKAISYAKRKFLKLKDKSHKYLYTNLPKNDGETIIFNIGGDTYCYDIPYVSYELNNQAFKKAIPTVFWGCSVEARTLENEGMIADINKYSAIVAREKLSEDIFKKCLKDTNKLYKTCDPAFHLETKEIELPKGFKEKNTLGLNISPVMFRNYNDPGDIMYQNAYCLIDYVLASTELSVCLIPHVYNIEKNTQDIMILRKIYEKYKDNERVSLVDKELSCTELKYIISKCRFFIGARTHSTIAAYSSAVPCIALSYSIKSRGIATDLFGTDKGYALPYKDISQADELKNAFASVLYDNEKKILKRYDELLPMYKQSIIDAAKAIIESL